MEEIKILIPEENYQILEFNQDNLPGVAVVNSALKDENLKKVFSWNCSILIDFDETAENGMPTNEELNIISQFDDFLDENIKGDLERPNALFFARVTWNSTLQLIWKVFDPEIVNNFLSQIIEDKSYPRYFDYRIEEDENWEITKWYSDNVQKKCIFTIFNKKPNNYDKIYRPKNNLTICRFEFTFFEQTNFIWR